MIKRILIGWLLFFVVTVSFGWLAMNVMMDNSMFSGTVFNAEKINNQDVYRLQMDKQDLELPPAGMKYLRYCTRDLMLSQILVPTDDDSCLADTPMEKVFALMLFLGIAALLFYPLVHFVIERWILGKRNRCR